jgi:hypothetical protein
MVLVVAALFDPPLIHHKSDLFLVQVDEKTT